MYLSITARRRGAVFDTITNVSATRSFGLMGLEAAQGWSLGKTTIRGSLTRTRYASSGVPLPRRRNAASIFPFDRPSASNGEYWLEIITSMLGSSSRKIRKASGIHLNSCPVKKPIVKHGLLG